jgi:hypothetical protein
MGVESQSETVWRQADQIQRPTCLFHQQNQPDRWRLLQIPRQYPQPSQSKRCLPDPPADWVRAEHQRCCRPRDYESLHLQGIHRQRARRR